MLQAIGTSDEALVARVADGDIAAFATLYDRYARRTHTWATHLLGASEADDVTQEVFIKLWDKAGTFDSARGRFGAWFGAVARHQILARARRVTLERRVVAAQEIDQLLADHPDPEPSVEARAWTSERDAALVAAIRELPAEQRRVIVMAYYAGLSQSDIAASTDTPLGTVKKRTRLALQKLRRAVADHGSERANAG